MNLQENIRKVLRETIESKWNTGNKHGNKYDYQQGYCHYFAYNIIGRLRKLYPKKKISYFLLLAQEIDKQDGAVVQDYLVHVYIKIDDILLDSNGLSTIDEALESLKKWEEDGQDSLPDSYEQVTWTEQSNKIPEMFFNNQFCNVNSVKRDVDRFLSHPEVKELLKI